MSVTETVIPTTDDVIVGMLTENTGRALCDSGDAYGRNWERNGGMDVAAFKARPEIVPSFGKDRDGRTVVQYVELDVFHFLSDRLSYNADADAEFRAFAASPDQADESWHANADAWLSDVGATDPFGRSGWQWVNTYNGDDALSQVLQFVLFKRTDDDETMALVQVHGGCDIRGGYTAPRIFDIYGDDGACMFENASFQVFLTEPEATPDALAQLPAFDEYPTPVGGRTIVTEIRDAEEGERGVIHRDRGGWDGWTTDDASTESIRFEFDKTPVLVADDGSLTIADGPAAGWSVAFEPPVSSC